MQTLGIIDIVWKGQKIPVEKGAKLRVGGLKSNVVTYGRRVAYAHEYQASEITATTHLARGQSFRALYSTGEGELQVLCDTGQACIFADAFLADDRPELTGGEALDELVALSPGSAARPAVGNAGVRLVDDDEIRAGAEELAAAPVGLDEIRRDDGDRKPFEDGFACDALALESPHRTG